MAQDSVAPIFALPHPRSRRPKPRSPSALAALALCACLTGAQAAPPPCPTDALDFDAKLAVVEAAPTCKGAAQVAASCAYGASGDVGLNEAVIAKCERDFLSQLDARGRKSYKNQREACQRKYAKMQGTMYVSMAAFCEANVALRYSERARGQGGSKERLNSPSARP